MNKQAFNARARVARAIAGIARRRADAWTIAQARVYGAIGAIGPDLGPYLDWYWGRSDQLPDVGFGSFREFTQ
jgi:hypothetical protein